MRNTTRFELLAPPLGPQARQRRQRRRGDRLADHRDGHLHETARVAQVGDRAGAEQGAEPALVPLVDGEQRLAEHQRRRDQQVAEEDAIERRDAGAQAHASAGVEQRREERAEHGADQRAPGEALEPTAADAAPAAGRRQ